MERLTKRENGHVHYPRCFEEPCGGMGCRTEDCEVKVEIRERLAAYEDTGLEPEEVLPKDKADEIALKLMRLADLESLCNYTRLRELAEADKDGRVVVPPCKVGDRLYEVTGRKTISVYKVKAIRVELFGLFIEWDIVEGFVWQSLSGINAGEIGKTVFLTREEAEKALEETMNTFCRIIAPDVGREWPEGRSDGRAQAQPHGHRREERRTAAEEEADGHGGEPGVGVRMDAEAHAVGHYGTGDKEEL